MFYNLNTWLPLYLQLTKIPAAQDMACATPYVAITQAMVPVPVSMKGGSLDHLSHYRHPLLTITSHLTFYTLSSPL